MTVKEVKTAEKTARGCRVIRLSTNIRMKEVNTTCIYCLTTWLKALIKCLLQIDSGAQNPEIFWASSHTTETRGVCLVQALQ